MEEPTIQDDEMSLKSGSPPASRLPSPDVIEIDPQNGANQADVMI